MADPDGSSQSGVGTDELEASQVRTGGGVGGCVPRVEGFLRVSRYPHCIGRGPLAGDIELRQTTQVQSGCRGRSSNNNSPDGQPVVSKHGLDDHKLHQ